MKRSLFWLGMVFVFALAGSKRQASKVAAQEDLRLLVDSTTMEFPRKIEFKLKAESETVIESIALRYGTSGRSCGSSGGRKPLDFKPDTKVELTWTWDLEDSGILPHGVEVWWQWEIRDETGTKLTSERRTMMVTDDRQPFQQLKRARVTISWLEGDEAFAQSLLDIVVTDLDRLEVDTGVQLQGDVRVVVYPTAAAVREALVHTTEWTGAVAFPQYNIVVAGISPGQDEWAASVLPHELAHLVIRAFTFNCSGIWLPTWLNEGLAEFAEGDRDAEAAAVVHTALAEGSLPNLRSLAYGFSASGFGAALAYEQSRQVVTFLLAEFGPEKMNELLSTMRDGQPIDEALMAVYRFDTDGLDSAWRVSLGAQPLVTAENETKGALPTAVATLPIFTVPVTPTTLPATATPRPTVTMTAPSQPTETPTTFPTPAPTTAATAAEVPAISQRSTPEPEVVAEVSDSPEDRPPANLTSGKFIFIIAGLLLAVLVVSAGALISKRSVQSSMPSEES